MCVLMASWKTSSIVEWGDENRGDNTTITHHQVSKLMIYKIEEKPSHVTAIRFLFDLPRCNKSYLLVHVHGMGFKARSILLTESHYFYVPCEIEMRDASVRIIIDTPSSFVSPVSGVWCLRSSLHPPSPSLALHYQKLHFSNFSNLSTIPHLAPLTPSE